jgi:nucleotidyltransferase/DNA polymerase involved in DNA repair
LISAHFGDSQSPLLGNRVPRAWVGGAAVLAASYKAKTFGIRGGMPGRRARELCPDVIFANGHFTEYQRLNDAANQTAQ